MTPAIMELRTLSLYQKSNYILLFRLSIKRTPLTSHKTLSRNIAVCWLSIYQNTFQTFLFTEACAFFFRTL